MNFQPESRTQSSSTGAMVVARTLNLSEASSAQGGEPMVIQEHGIQEQQERTERSAATFAATDINSSFYSRENSIWQDSQSSASSFRSWDVRQHRTQQQQQHYRHQQGHIQLPYYHRQAPQSQHLLSHDTNSSRHRSIPINSHTRSSASSQSLHNSHGVPLTHTEDSSSWTSRLLSQHQPQTHACTQAHTHTQTWTPSQAPAYQSTAASSRIQEKTTNFRHACNSQQQQQQRQQQQQQQGVSNHQQHRQTQLPITISSSSSSSSTPESSAHTSFLGIIQKVWGKKENSTTTQRRQATSADQDINYTHSPLQNTLLDTNHAQPTIIRSTAQQQQPLAIPSYHIPTPPINHSAAPGTATLSTHTSSSTGIIPTSTRIMSAHSQPHPQPQYPTAHSAPSHVVAASAPAHSALEDTYTQGRPAVAPVPAPTVLRSNSRSLRRVHSSRMLLHRDSRRLRSNVAYRVQRDLFPGQRFFYIFVLLFEIIAESGVLFMSKQKTCERPLYLWMQVLMSLQIFMVALNIAGIWLIKYARSRYSLNSHNHDHGHGHGHVSRQRHGHSHMFVHNPTLMPNSTRLRATTRTTENHMGMTSVASASTGIISVHPVQTTFTSATTVFHPFSTYSRPVLRSTALQPQSSNSNTARHDELFESINNIQNASATSASSATSMENHTRRPGPELQQSDPAYDDADVSINEDDVELLNAAIHDVTAAAAAAEDSTEFRLHSDRNLAIFISSYTTAIARWSRILSSWYLIWIIIGSIWISESSSCAKTSPHLYRLALTLISIYYVFLGLPVACFCLIMCFLPLFIRLLVPYAERVHRQGRMATPEQINNLPTKIYESTGPSVVIIGSSGRSHHRNQVDEEGEEVIVVDGTDDESGTPGQEEASGVSSCVICLCDYESGERITRLPCNHQFHSSCINEWLVVDKSCPLCKKDIDGSENV